MTLAQLDSLLQARLDNPGFWSDYERIVALNEGISLFQLATGRWRQRYILTTLPKRVFYDISTLPQLQVRGICQVIAPIRASFNGSAPLGWTSYADMDLAYPGWQTVTTATSGAAPQPTMCGPAGLNLMWIYPADAAGGNSLQLDCLANAPTLVNPGDFVNLDQTETVALLDYSQSRLSLKRGGIFFARTVPLQQSFFRVLADRNSYLCNIAVFRQLVGADFARNYYPRRQSERSGKPVGVGLH